MPKNLIFIQKGLVKVTQSLKKANETFQLIHGKFKIYLAQSELDQLTCCASYEAMEIQGN